MKRFLRIPGILLAFLVVLFLIFRTPDTDADEMRAKYGGGASQFVELANGTTVHLRDEGPRDGLPVILLHGSNSSLHTWDDWTEQLSAQYRIIRFDQIGHGLTGPARDGDYSKARHVADVHAVAEHLELDRFVLAGNSMGGWVSTAYAIEHPDRLLGLGLLNASGAPRKEGEGRLYLGAVIASTPVLRNAMTAITPRSLVRSSMEDAVADPSMITEEAIDRYWELLRYPGNRQAVVDRASTNRGGPFDAGDVAALTMPALIMWGEEDLVVPTSGADWYAEHLPNDRSVIYAGVAHIPMEEVPERSATDFAQWLSELPVNNREPASTEPVQSE